MTSLKHRLGNPRSLTHARSAAHAAAQLLAKAARANAVPAADGSHTALTWSTERGGLLTAPLGPGDAQVRIGLGFTPLRISVQRAGDVIDTLALPGQTLARAEDWLDGRLVDLGLDRASSVTLRYDLPDDVTKLDRFADDEPGLATLAAWFALAADALSAMARDLADLDPGPGAVLCWPHHFDIAAYVELEHGDPETARGIGVGLSPGDESYDQPYFYVNPWPHPDVSGLPAPIPPGHWHTAGFIGSIATGEEVLTLDDIGYGTEVFLRESFDTGRSAITP